MGPDTPPPREAEWDISEGHKKLSAIGEYEIKWVVRQIPGKIGLDLTYLNYFLDSP
jgi:hypothetical protein